MSEARARRASRGEDPIPALVESAKAGDRAALESLLGLIRDDVYNLALRMLWHPEDAEDATQEILIRILTHLGGFRGESSFRTWTFRIAVNALLTTRRRRMEREVMSFEEFGEDLAAGLAGVDPYGPAEPEQRLLEEEVKVGCTQGMLLCLDREHRIAFVLGEVFGLSGKEAAEILDVSPATYRQRLSRSRRRLRTFMQGHCGLVNRDAACRCRKRIDRAVALGRVDPDHLLFAGRPLSQGMSYLRERVTEMGELHRAAAVFRSHPNYAAPERLREAVSEVLESGRFGILSRV